METTETDLCELLGYARELDSLMADSEASKCIRSICASHDAQSARIRELEGALAKILTATENALNASEEAERVALSVLGEGSVKP